MKKETKKVAIPLLLGIVLIAMVGTFAAIYTSTTTQADVSTDNLGIELVQTGGSGAVSMSATNKYTGGFSYKGVPGDTVAEQVAVKNTGSRDAYARVIINRSWQKDGTKVSDLDPQEISILRSSGDWYVDEASDSNHEQIVCYYKAPIAPGATTANVMDSFAVLKDQLEKNTNAYSGYESHIEFKADGIQTSAAKDAMLAEWGVKVNLDSSGNITAMPTEQQD